MTKKLASLMFFITEISGAFHVLKNYRFLYIIPSPLHILPLSLSYFMMYVFTADGCSAYTPPKKSFVISVHFERKSSSNKFSLL